MDKNEVQIATGKMLCELFNAPPRCIRFKLECEEGDLPIITFECLVALDPISKEIITEKQCFQFSLKPEFIKENVTG